MRILGFGICGLIAAFALLIAGALALGKTQPPPERLAQLHLSDCALPCWLGIIPGETSFDEAVARVKAAYPQAVVLPEESQVAFGLRVETLFGRIILAGESDGVIREISLSTTQIDGLALGDIVNLLGKPTNPVGADPHSAFYQCDNALAIVSVGGIQGGWQQPLGVISIRGNGPDTCTVERR